MDDGLWDSFFPPTEVPYLPWGLGPSRQLFSIGQPYKNYRIAGSFLDKPENLAVTFSKIKNSTEVKQDQLLGNFTEAQSQLTSSSESQITTMGESSNLWHQLWHITLVSTVMFLGCFVSGMIPLSTSLSDRKIKMCSLFGAGLLVGVALAVIIPEGVQALYSLDGDNSGSEHGNTIAFSLITGFIMMLLIDNIGGGHSHSHGGSNNGHSHGLNETRSATPNSPYQRLATEETDSSSTNNSQINVSSPPQKKGSGATITLGLIVHAAADGIALGAASATERSDLQFIFGWISLYF